MATVDRTDFFVDPADDIRELAFIPADRGNASTLSTDQIDRYNRDGFLGGLQVFDDREGADVAAYFDDLIEKVVSADDRRNSYSINSYQMVCRRIYDLVHTTAILDYVQDILGPDFICWGTQLFCKQPNDPMEVPVHQDAVYWPFTPTHSVTAWLAIDDADESNAAMSFAPGSHLLGAVPHVEKALDGSRVLKHTIADPLLITERVSNNLKRGQLSLHSDLLWHGSPANSSARRRAGLTIRYTSAEVAVVPGWENWYIPVTHCRGQIPTHWPNRRRPDGEHPEKMAAFRGTFDGTLPDAG